MIPVTPTEFTRALSDMHEPLTIQHRKNWIGWTDFHGYRARIINWSDGHIFHIDAGLHERIKGTSMTAYRHAEKMIEYGQDALTRTDPWNGWQARRNAREGWRDLNCHPTWHPMHEYRRRPNTVTFNGEELPAPETEAPEIGTKYFMPDVQSVNYATVQIWSNSYVDKCWLEMGLVHLVEEAARKWGHATVYAIKKATS